MAHSGGNYVAEYVDGKTPAETGQLDEEAIVQAVGHMPLGQERCPGLAIKALRHALSQIGAAESKELERL